MNANPQPGWYPDPAGAPLTLRWWDGTRWTDRTRPATPAPHRPASRGRLWALLAGAVALVLVVGLVAAFILTRPRTTVVTGGPTPTGSIWDETTSPTPSPSPTPSTSSSPTQSARPAACDDPAPDELPAPPADGRVHGGPLSTALLPGWSGPRAEHRVPLGRDAHGMGQRVAEETALGWESSVTLGVIADRQASDTAATASLLMTCLATSDFYWSVDARLGAQTTRAITVDHVPATQVDAVVSFDDPRLQTKGSALRVIVVRTSPLTFCFSAVPKERADLRKTVDRAAGDLRVD